MKHCSVCRQRKDESEFDRRRDRASGYASCCKACRRARANNAYHRNKHGDPEAWGERNWNPPDAEYFARKCMTCRSPFQTANDYRLCPRCRDVELLSFGTVFLCEGAYEEA